MTNAANLSILCVLKQIKSQGLGLKLYNRTHRSGRTVAHPSHECCTFIVVKTSLASSMFLLLTSVYMGARQYLNIFL